MLPRSHEVALAPLLSRRSVSALVGPAPTAQEIDAILQAAVTVPDHGGLRPWRLVVATGEARSAFGDALAATARERLPDLSEATLQRVRRKAFAAPTLITVVARLDQETRVPRWERVASAACVGYAITLAAHQLGLGAMWKSIPFVAGTALRRPCSTWRRTTSSSAGSTSVTPRPTTTPTARPDIDLTPIARRPRRRRAPRALLGRELTLTTRPDSAPAPRG